MVVGLSSLQSVVTLHVLMHGLKDGDPWSSEWYMYTCIFLYVAGCIKNTTEMYSFPKKLLVCYMHILKLGAGYKENSDICTENQVHADQAIPLSALHMEKSAGGYDCSF